MTELAQRFPSIVSVPTELLPHTPRVAIAMGVFDGVHLGHQAILRELIAVARETHSVPVVLSFYPHPKKVLFPPGPPLLTPLPMQETLFFASGAQRLVRVSFTKKLAACSPERFLEDFFLVEGLTVTAFCVGDNWRFGKGNGGDADFLSRWAVAHGIRPCIVPCVQFGGENISSTRVRAAVQAGDLERASAMLGRPYAISGIVEHGQGIARTRLDCPTANLVEPGQVRPPEGVYAARARVDGRLHSGIVYVGTAPTIREDHATVLELHLFDVECELYGKQIEVEFGKFVRPSIRFANREALQEQIRKDIAVVRQWFAEDGK
ncbi:MAG: riboflavin biosynthesis protein RibF [Victivallales bacterium]|nr:riboflavin biosynthesis protein RibF [Victivallales bacterium]